MPQEFMDESFRRIADPTQVREWKAKYRFPIKAVTITNSNKNMVSVYIVLGAVRQHRELIFTSDVDARDFAQAVQLQLDNEPDRLAHKLDVTANGVQFNDLESVTMLIEISSARKLIAGDVVTSDPYVQVLFDGKEVHRTDFVPKWCVGPIGRHLLVCVMTQPFSLVHSLDPIWTVKTNSLFLWTIHPKDLFMSDGLLCVVFDFDQVGTHENLGQVYIPPDILYKASEERVELPLKPPSSSTAKSAGYLAIRCRRASDYDHHFMAELAETRKKEKREAAMPELHKIKNLTKLATESAGGSGNVASMLTRRSKIVKSAEHPEGIKMVSFYASYLYPLECIRSGNV